MNNKQGYKNKREILREKEMQERDVEKAKGKWFVSCGTMRASDRNEL